MSAAIFGLLGVIVGGVLNGVVSWRLELGQSRSSARAVAGVVYDDFLHLQSTLVRSLAAGRWWTGTYLLEEQVERQDWKLLLGTLEDEPSQDVAAARGWMTYLIGRWHEVMAASASPDPPLLRGEDLWLMRDTFARLERARTQLSKLSGRRFSTFEDGGVLATIDPPTNLTALGIDPEQCRARRKAGYARPSA